MLISFVADTQWCDLSVIGLININMGCCSLELLKPRATPYSVNYSNLKQEMTRI